MKHFLLFICLLSLIMAVCNGQEKNPLINSGDLIKEGVQQHDSGYYKKAINLYQQVDRNDTNYVYALYEMALSYSADSQFQKGIAICEEALSAKADRQREPEIYTEYASLIDAAGDRERALKIFDSAIAKYPAYSLLYLNKGTTLIGLNRFTEAEELFKKTLLIDPYCNSCHYMLGITALQQGKLIPAFLSFIGYLLVMPDGRYSKKAIGLLDVIAKNKDEIHEYIDKRKEEPDDNYKMAEQILLSKIALDKKYKPIIELDDPISRQIQVVFEKINYQEDDNDFWMQYYIPFFKKVFSTGKFDYFINHIFSDVDIKTIKEFLKKNKKEYQAFRVTAAEYFNLIRNSRELNFTKRKAEGLIYLYTNDEYSGSGNYIASSDKLTGPWNFYYNGGNIKAMGQYNDNGKREGAWSFYYFNGKLKGKEHYADGKEEGEEIYYFANGNISTHSFYKNNILEGESSSYFLAGPSHTISHYQNGKLQGEKKEFYSSGNLQSVENYSADQLNGSFKTYHQNGTVESTGSYSNGKLDGPYKSYYADAKPNIDAAYSKDLPAGTWTYYFNNGKIKKIVPYVNGKVEGEYKEYFDNGQLFTSYMNKKGNTNGEAKYYDDDGKLYSILFFENDVIKSGKYYDKTGKEISASEMKGKQLDLTTFRADGTKHTRVIYNDKGETTGTETYYYWSGKINATSQYANGEMNGLSVNYYRNGQKENEINYTDGKKDGYYKSYFAHGSLESEGWYKNGKANGYWLYYDEQGHLTSKIYYSDDEKNGYKEEFLPNGKKEFEIKYNLGWMDEFTQFDSTGKQLNHIEFVKNSGRFKILFPNGKTKVEANYVNGNYDGAYTTYFFDGSIESVLYYKKGIEDSIYRSYLYGGEKSVEGQYKMGEKTGLWKYYRTGGILAITEEYANGKLNGHKIVYFDNGKPDYDVVYKDDDRQGYSKKYEPGGSFAYQIHFDTDLPIGYSYADKTGNLVKELPIVAGTAKVKAFYSNGSVSSEFEYIDGKVKGSDILYYPNGKIWEQSTDDYGYYEGALKEYYPSGQLKTDYNYLHDNLNGVCREYDEKGLVTEEGNYYNGVWHGSLKSTDAKGHQTISYLYYGKLLSATK